MSEDILRPLPFEKWHFLQLKLKHEWPKFAYIYYWIENAIQWKKKKPDISIQIYCPEGNSEQGTFVAIANYSIYIVTTFTLNPKDGSLENALKETQLIDWSQGVHFSAVHEFIRPIIYSTIESIKNIHNLEMNVAVPSCFYYKSVEDCAKVEISVPSECYLKPLNVSDIPLIHSEWPHKDTERPDLSMKYLGAMVEMNGGLGLHLKENDSLVAWALQNEWHGLGIVQTLKNHRRKGYAKIVINAMARKLADKEIPVSLFIVQGNVLSETMFKGLGWQRIAAVEWIILKRQNSTIKK